MLKLAFSDSGAKCFTNTSSSSSALIAAFDKAKKKYQGKLKKLEIQIQSLTERYEGQVCIEISFLLLSYFAFQETFFA